MTDKKEEQKNKVLFVRHSLTYLLIFIILINFFNICYAQETFEYINSEQENVISCDKKSDVSFYQIKIPVKNTKNPNFIRIEDCNSVLSQEVVFLIQDSSIDNAFLYKIDANKTEESPVEIIEEPLFNDKDSLIISDENNNVYAINCKLQKISKYDRFSKSLITKEINLLYRHKYKHMLSYYENKLYIIGGYDLSASFCNSVEIINLKDLTKEKTINTQSDLEGGTFLLHCGDKEREHYLLGCKSKTDNKNNIVGVYTDKNFSSITELGKLKFNPNEEYIVQSSICLGDGRFERVIFSVNKTSNEINKIDINSFSKTLIEIPSELKNKNLKVFFPYFIFDDQNKFYLTIFKSDGLKIFAEIKKTDKNSECKKLYERRLDVLNPIESKFIIVGPPKEGNIFEIIQIKTPKNKRKGNIW